MQNLQEIKLINLLLHNNPIQFLIPLILYPKLPKKHNQLLFTDKFIHLIDILTIVISILQKKSMYTLMYLIDIVIFAIEDLLGEI